MEHWSFSFSLPVPGEAPENRHSVPHFQSTDYPSNLYDPSTPETPIGRPASLPRVSKGWLAIIETQLGEKAGLALEFTSRLDILHECVHRLVIVWLAYRSSGRFSARFTRGTLTRDH